MKTANLVIFDTFVHRRKSFLFLSYKESLGQFILWSAATVSTISCIFLFIYFEIINSKISLYALFLIYNVAKLHHDLLGFSHNRVIT